MKFTFIPIFVFLLWSFALNAQAKINLSSGKLVIKSVDRVTIQGHSGSAILIDKAGDKKEKVDERAQGLREINAKGLLDNTGIGLATQMDGNTVEVTQLSRSSKTRYIVKVPAGVAVSYEHSHHTGETVIVENAKNEIEISTNHNDVRVRNSSGPLAINTVHGDIDVVFSGTSVNKDVTLYSSHGHVDVSIPTSTKANFRLKTSHGKMFTDLDLKIEASGNESSSYSHRQEITYKMNGGGINFAITSVHDNIYLRKL